MMGIRVRESGMCLWKGNEERRFESYMRWGSFEELLIFLDFNLSNLFMNFFICTTAIISDEIFLL